MDFRTTILLVRESLKKGVKGLGGFEFRGKGGNVERMDMQDMGVLARDYVGITLRHSSSGFGEECS